MTHLGSIGDRFRRRSTGRYRRKVLPIVGIGRNGERGTGPRRRRVPGGGPGDGLRVLSAMLRVGYGRGRPTRAAVVREDLRGVHGRRWLESVGRDQLYGAIGPVCQQAAVARGRGAVHRPGAVLG